MSLSFAFDTSKGETPETLARKRAVAQALAQGIGSPNNVGEGLSAIGKAIAYRSIMSKADKAEAAGLASGSADLAGLYGGDAQPAGDVSSTDPIIQAIIQQESGGNPNAVSPKGAVGTMQIMPATAADPGFGVRPIAPDKLTDPAENVRFGTDYFNAMRKRYGGDMTASLAAYNAGPGVADKFVAGGGDQSALPAETRNYVSSVMGQQPPSGVQRVAQALGGEGQQAMRVLNNPWSTDGAKAVAKAMLDRMTQQSDPLRQTQLEEEKIKLDQLRNPPPAERPWWVRPDGSVDPAYIAGQKAGATSVNVGPNGEQFGSPGEGLAWVRNPDGTVKTDERGLPVAGAFQGGKAYVSAADAAAKDAAAKDISNVGANVVVQDVDRALDAIGKNPGMTTGIGGALTKGIPATPAYNVGALIETVKANSAFDKLQAMRNASPTGGALGNVSDTEGRLLAAAIGNLEQAQGTDQITDNLRRVKNIYLDTIYGSAEKRAALVQQGVLSADQNKQIDAQYVAPSFEQAPGNDAPPPSFTIPGATPEDLGKIWKFMPPEDRKLFQ